MSKTNEEDLNESDVKINPDEDDIVCVICQDGDVYEGNEIIFCDKCNVPVHQVCYGVDTLPDGEWFCNPCESNEDPSVLTCVLCSNHGGAYKPTEKSGQWVHSLCAFWIPEIFTTRIRGVPTFTLTSLDKKRFKLNCNLCKSKGACIQCSYGRCAVAAHPYCVLTQPQGFTRRTIKDDRGELLWEVFCKPHASAVSEPLKPKAKVKLQDDFEEEEEEIIYETVVKTRKIESKAKDDSRYNSLSMSHALAFNTGSSQTVRPGLIGYRQSSILHDDDEDDEDDDEDDDKKKNKKSRAGKGKAPSSSTRSSSAPVLLTSSSTQSYPVHTMSEWPGQTEGEAMDLTHFWNVVSMSFPEDHTSEWVKHMLENLNDGVESYEAIATSPLGPHAIVSSAEPSVQAVEELERRLSALGTDKDRFAVLDLGKRSAFLSTTDRIIQSIDQINAKLCSLDVDQLKDFIETLSLDAMNATTVQRAEVTQLGSSSSSACPALPIPPSVSHIPAMLDEDSFLVAKWGKEDPEEQLEIPTDDGVVTLKVAIDGAHRQGVQLQVRLKTGESDKKNGADWTTFSLGDSAEEPLVNGLPAKLLFIGPELGADSICDEQLTSVDVRLVKSNPIDDTNQVVLSDREIISKSEDDGLARMIKSSQQILEKLTGTVSESFHMFNKLQLLEIANESQDQRQAWTKLEEAYSKQRVWRKVASTMIRGIRDQKPDFNRAVDEAVPASWTIKVDGRPTVKDTAAADEEEPQEDAVCMVCFDGSSNDNNKIIFCDGCNAALHQMCYGINEVPEGDFYCDRCEAVQAIASERGEKEDEIPSEDVKNAIKCCLCPQHHGGIKPTTDGRWVHLCCALWAENSLITNLDDMSPINVSKVPVQIPENNLISASWNRQIYSTNEFSQRYPMSNSQNVCSVCNVKGGFVTACTESCGDVFHPLCAWFRGLYFFSELTDPSFSGRERAGLYPSGVNFKIYCAQHGPRPKIDTSTTNAPTEVTAVISQDQDPCSEQKIIRDKYRIKEFDLEYVPGKGGRRRKRKKQKVSAVRSDRANIISKVKDLARDVYDTKKCACCFTPFDLSPLLEAPTQPATENTVSDLPTEPVVVDVHDVNDAPPVVSMSSSEIVIKEESRIESTDVEPAKDKKTFEALLQSYEAICFDCKSVSLPKVVSLPAIDAHVTSEAMVNGDDHTEQSISPTKIVENNDGAAEEEAPPSPRGKVGRKPKSKQAPSKVRFSDRSSSEELQLGSPRNGEAIDGVPSMDIDADTDNKEKELAERMLVAAEANLRKYEDYPDKISCQKCQIALHFKCAFPSREILSAADFDVNNWVCTPCLDEVPDPRCVFCPRRGGFYRSTRTDHYIHQHCVLRSPGNTRIQIDGVVEVLGIPKESKKHLCFLCNRKEGVFSRCSGLGCTTYFHSLCGERSGRVYSKIRFGELVQYCHEHVPEGVERTPQGWWIDEAELFRLHYVLDRSRLIVDMLGRRDKYKRNLSKTEADIFRRRFYRSLDKAKGRKYQDPDGLGDGDSEGEYEDDEENDLMNGAVGMSPEHIKTGKVGKLSKKPCWQDLPPESDITTKTSGGLRVDISGSYVRGDDVKVPALVEVAVAGAVITKRFVKNKESESLQRIMEAIQTNPNLYTSRKDRDTFLKDIQKLLTAVATLPDKLFRTEIGKNLSRLPEHLQVDFEFLQAGRRSRDQVAPESVPKTTSSSAPSSKAGPGRKRKGNDDDNEYEVEPVSKGGKGGKISKVDEKADAGVVEDKGGRKKSAFMPTIEEDPVGAKKTGAKSGPLDKFLVKTAPVPKRSAPIVNAPLPQYVTLVSAERELKSNPLFASLDLAFSDGGIDFSSIAALSGLDALVPPTELDWELCDSPEKRIRLEARILDILNEIDSYEVPVQRAVESSSSSSSSTAAKLNQQSSAASGRSSDRKRTAATFYQPGASSGASKSRHALSPSSSPAQPMRFLAGEFTEIPDDQIPDYDEYVRRRLTIATLKKKLLRHKYLYMAAFEKDFYELLNNGIYVTEGDPETRADALALAKLFQSAKVKSLNPQGLTSSRSGGQAALTVKAMGSKAKKGKGTLPVAPCAHCREVFEVTGWPESTALPNQSEGPAAVSTVPSGDWQWLCPPCVLKQGAELIDKKVQVWWQDDEQYYSGVVQAYDAASERHCVLYDDREWEFINLGTEPVLLSSNKIKANATSLKENGKSGRSNK